MRPASSGSRILQEHPRLASRLLAHWVNGGTKLHGFRKKIFESLVSEVDARYYSQTCTSEERERLKALCMGGTSAVMWARQYLKRGFPEAQTSLLPMFGQLEELLESSDSLRVHQVGCCSGREIAYYASRYPRSSFLGSDYDKDLILFLRETWGHLPNLRFGLFPLQDEDAVRTQSPCDLLVASGGLHYLDGGVLMEFFSGARRFAGKILLSQPLDEHFDAGKLSASTPRKQMSWNHPYPALLESAGWRGVDWRETVIEGVAGIKNIAVLASSMN